MNRSWKSRWLAVLLGLISGAANEFLFPVGCAFVIYVSKGMRKLGNRTEEPVD